MADDRMMELRPCPFCGSSNVSVCRNTWSDGREGRYVECGECEAASGSWPVGTASYERATELAAMKWNRRSQIERLLAERDRLRATLERIATWPDMAYHVADVAELARAAAAATPAVTPPACSRCGGTRTVRFGAPCPECATTTQPRTRP